MPFSPDDIIANPELGTVIKSLAQDSVEFDQKNTKMATAFGTQQRWMLGQLGLSLHFQGVVEEGSSNLNAAAFFDQVENLGIASRNTADTFLQQMVAFGALRPIDKGSDRRKRFLEATELTLDAINSWMSIRLKALDGLDQGNRLQRYRENPEAIKTVQPLLAESFLRSAKAAAPQTPMSPFLWANNGFIVTDHLVIAMDGEHEGSDQCPTCISSITDLADRLVMSRTNATQRLREAEAVGAIGWARDGRKSRLWVSRQLIDIYTWYQAIILSQVNAAYDTYFAVAPNER